MGFFNKLTGGFSNNPQANDQYWIDDDYSDDGYYDTPGNGMFQKGKNKFNVQPQPSKFGGIFNRNKQSSYDETEEEDDRSGYELSFIVPKSFEDSKTICKYLLDGKAVMISVEGLNTETAQRVLDFTLGAVYAIDGDFRKMSKNSFVAAPNSIELSGDYQGDYSSVFSKGSNASAPMRFPSSNF